MTEAAYNEPYGSKVKGLGGMQNNSAARTISGGNKRRTTRKK